MGFVGNKLITSFEKVNKRGSYRQRRRGYEMIGYLFWSCLAMGWEGGMDQMHVG